METRYGLCTRGDERVCEEFMPGGGILAIGSKTMTVAGGTGLTGKMPALTVISGPDFQTRGTA